MKNPNHTTMAQRFRALRKYNKRMTLKEFAAHTGVPMGTLGGMETGKFTPHAETLIKVCKACGVSAHWLLTGDEKAPRVAGELLDVLARLVREKGEVGNE